MVNGRQGGKSSEGVLTEDTRTRSTLLGCSKGDVESSPGDGKCGESQVTSWAHSGGAGGNYTSHGQLPAGWGGREYVGGSIVVDLAEGVKLQQETQSDCGSSGST